MPIQFDQSFPEWYAAVKFCDLDYFFSADSSYVFATPTNGVCDDVFFSTATSSTGFIGLSHQASRLWRRVAEQSESITEEHFHNLMEYLRADI